eukprot:COSAG01_NODE_28306_length_664_cov_1.106195_1_plen_93_part_10
MASQQAQPAADQIAAAAAASLIEAASQQPPGRRPRPRRSSQQPAPPAMHYDYEYPTQPEWIPTGSQWEVEVPPAAPPALTTARVARPGSCRGT